MVFGLAHGYYHKIMIVVMVQGWLLGVLAHGLQDGIGGLVAFFS
jgi:hypothetical protein